MKIQKIQKKELSLKDLQRRVGDDLYFKILEWNGSRASQVLTPKCERDAYKFARQMSGGGRSIIEMTVGWQTLISLGVIIAEIFELSFTEDKPTAEYVYHGEIIY